jgi:hypothetical protein
MRLRNYTDLPDEWLREVIRAVCPPGVSGFDVRVSNSSHGGRGRAYAQGSSYHDRACPFVIVSLSKPKAFKPYWTSGGKGYIRMPIGSRKEQAVHLLAHELRHLWQGKSSGKRRGMVWGARGKMSERDADAYALNMLRRFRRGELAGGSR